ncbi:DDE-domain-containing protein, partial [Wilcoxina mikolae CBS 423.85]
MKRVLITDIVLRIAAETLIEQLRSISDSTEDYTDFSFSNGWLAAVKNRNELSSKKLRGSGGDVDEVEIPQMRKDLQEELDDYPARDIFNCDEMALQGKEYIRGIKSTKTRVSVFLTCNADGSEKYDIMIIGKAYSPLCFRRADTLPFIYRNNKKAWMLSGIWYEYLTTLNHKMKAAGRRIVLVTDNCPSHPPPNRSPKDYTGPPPPVLTHVKLVYLPKNTTPFLQPLDQGIIRALKASYRRKYAQSMVDYFNIHGEPSKELELFPAMLLLLQAWKELPPKVIFNCWQKAGILSSIDR